MAALLVLAFLAASCLIVPLPVDAEPMTIVVPDDYPTVFAAVENAVAGDTIFVKKGTYEGAINQTLVIRKAISIIGEDSKTTILSLHPQFFTQMLCGTRFSSYGDSIRIEANGVRISGLTINGDAGIVSANGNRTQITGNIFHVVVVLNGYHQTFAENTLFDVYLRCTGAYASINNNIVYSGTIISGSHCEIFANNVTGQIGIGGTSNYALIYDNIVRDGTGISIASNGNTIANNTISNCSRGISHYLGFNNNAYGNVISDIRGPALKFTEGSNFTFIQNRVADNLVGVQTDALTFTMFHNSFVNNDLQIEILDDSVYFWSMDNGKEGNYWSDYNGKDADGDGIGDSQYFVKKEIVDRFPLMAPVDNGGNPVLPSLTPSVTASPEPFPTALAATVSAASVVIAGAGLLIYFKKRKR